MEESPHEGRLSLIHDAQSGQDLLHDATLGLTCELPAGGSWDLTFDNNGMGIVRSVEAGAEVAQSASEFFEFALMTMGSSLHVLSRSGGVTCLQDFKQEHETLEVPLRQQAAAHTSVCLVYRLRHCWGAFCFWSLRSLRSLFCRTPELSYSKWYQNWWQWWEKYLGRIGIAPSEHLRRPVRTLNSAKRVKMDIVENNLDVRIFSEVAASSYAVLALLVRWSCPSVSRVTKDEGGDLHGEHAPGPSWTPSSCPTSASTSPSWRAHMSMLSPGFLWQGKDPS